MTEISLTKGKVALIDDADYWLIPQFKWQYAKAKNAKTGYAQTGIRKEDGSWTTLPMHHFLLAVTDGYEPDHIDRNGLNNQRHNLRIANKNQNKYNTTSHRGSSSIYKGVYWKKDRKKWLVRAQINGKRMYLGYFTDEVQAAHAYDEAARKYHGEFACLNFT